MRTCFSTLLLFCLACPTPVADRVAAQRSEGATQAPALPPLRPWENEEPREVKVKNNLLAFEYSWPLEAFSIPKLNAHFEGEAAKAKAQAIETAREDKADRGKDVPFTRHESSTVWKILSDQPGLLSLAAEIDIFVGGAERSSLYSAILWDKKLERPIEVGDSF